MAKTLSTLHVMNKMPLAKMLEIRLYKNYSSLEIHRVASDVFFPDLGAVEALVFLNCRAAERLKGAQGARSAPKIF